MSCNICYNKFDHYKHKPFSLSSCPHTFCNYCLTKIHSTCPICKNPFKTFFPNLALLDLIPQSDYDKSIIELDKVYNETKSLRNKLKQEREKKCAELYVRIDEIISQIDQSTNRIINSVLAKQKELLNQANTHKSRLNNLIQCKYTLDTKSVDNFHLAKSNLNTYSLSQEQIIKLSEEMVKTKEKLNQMQSELNTFQTQIEFIPDFKNYSIDIGHINNQLMVILKFLLFKLKLYLF